MNNILFTFFFILNMCLTSCFINDKEQGGNYVNSNYDTDIESLEVPSQYFDIIPDMDTVIYGKKGTKVIFLRGCFPFKNGKVTIEMKEFYGIPEMLKQRLTTTSNNKILETSGMVFITSTSTSIVREKCLVLMPKSNSKNEMALFYGEQALDVINWLPEVEYSDASSLEADTISFINKDSLFNIFEITRLGWINADKFVVLNGKKTLFIRVPNGEENAFYSLVFKRFNSIIPCYQKSNNVLEFRDIPSGEEVTLVGIGRRGGQYYLGMLDLNTSINKIDVSELSPVSNEELEIKLLTKFGSAL